MLPDNSCGMLPEVRGICLPQDFLGSIQGSSSEARGACMAVHTVTLHLPSALYERVTQCAEQTGRTIEDQVLDILAAAMWTSEDLPAELARTLTALALLDDAAPCRAARSQLDPSAGERIAALHD